MTSKALPEGLAVTRESPLTEDLTLLFARHTADMHADTPPESIHMMPRETLEIPEVAFFVIRDHGQPLAMGAIKQIAPEHAEIKSMHVLQEARGRGLARIMLETLIAHVKRENFARLSLETGVQPTFIAARGLYERAGFVECSPFEGYLDDPNSVFMTLNLRLG